MAAPAPSSQQEIRRRNLSRVLHAVAAGDPVSRAAVAARIGLTRAAVSTLVDELLRAGLLVEQGPGRSGAVGRPGTVLALSDRGPCGIGAEIGVDHLAVCAVDLRGGVRARQRVAAANRDSAPEPVLRHLTELLERVRAQVGAEGLRPAGLTVAVPGLVARGTTTVVRAPNLGWRNVDPSGALGAFTPAGGGSGAQGAGAHGAGSKGRRDAAGAGGAGRPGRPGGARLTVDNEANLGALAELWLGERPGGPPPLPPDFVHVSAEIGIGAAVVIDGELLRGTHGFGGEIGHVPVYPRGRTCVCGGRGCLEQYAGEEAVLRAAGLGTEPGARLARLVTRAEAGDPTTLRALGSAGTALGIALAGAVNLLDPGRVVLGGSLARVAPWLLPHLERELFRRSAEQPVVTVSALGPDGPLLGAAHTAVRAVLDDPLAHRVT